MSTHVAFLRGLNVGGRNKVAMSDLRNLLGDLGFTGVKSLLASGNLLFRSVRRTGAALERLLEKQTAEKLGVSAVYVVRSLDELQRAVAGNPFPNQAKDAPAQLLVMFLKTAPRKKNVDALRASIQGPEIVRCDGRQLYIVYPAGVGRSKLTAGLIERSLDSAGTARNWSTLQKLLALAR